MPLLPISNFSLSLHTHTHRYLWNFFSLCYFFYPCRNIIPSSTIFFSRPPLPSGGKAGAGGK